MANSQDGFTKCYEQCVKLSNAFLDEVVGKDSTVNN